MSKSEYVYNDWKVEYLLKRASTGEVIIVLFPALPDDWWSMKPSPDPYRTRIILFNPENGEAKEVSWLGDTARYRDGGTTVIATKELGIMHFHAHVFCKKESDRKPWTIFNEREVLPGETYNRATFKQRIEESPLIQSYINQQGFKLPDV